MVDEVFVIYKLKFCFEGVFFIIICLLSVCLFEIYRNVVKDLFVILIRIFRYLSRLVLFEF